MKAIILETKISASSTRSLELQDIKMIAGGLCLHVQEEFGMVWKIEFHPIQAWKVTTEECAGKLLSRLPDEGALFVSADSEWLRDFGDTELTKKAKHFIVCCYDEVIEVIAWEMSVSEEIEELSKSQ